MEIILKVDLEKDDLTKVKEFLDQMSKTEKHPGTPVIKKKTDDVSLSLDSGENNSTENKKEPGVSLSDLRMLLASKVESHRDKIKSELSKFSAKNLSSLDSEHYETFYTYLSKLK